MSFVPEITLSDLQIKTITDAPIGSFLQISDAPNDPRVVLRSELNVANGVAPGVVILEGDDAGRFLHHGDFPHYRVLDVTDLVVLVVAKPAVFAPVQRPGLQPGGIYRGIDQANRPVNCMAIVLPGAGIRGYVRLDGHDRGEIINLNLNEVPVYLGNAAVVPFEVSRKRP